MPEIMHRFGLPETFDPQSLEAVSLVPGPHLAGGEHLLPVVRSQMALAIELCALPGLAAIGWGPALSASSAEHFSSSVARWLEGGVFPGFGLTALREVPGGGLQSTGLAFFTGQELAIPAELARDKPAAARLALRLIHELVGAGGLAQREEITGLDGEALVLAPCEGGALIEVSAA